MSRIGKKAIPLPSGVEVSRTDREVRVKGPKGQLAQSLPESIEMQVEGSTVRFTRPDERKETRAQHGLARALLANMVKGVTEGFTRELEIEGVGYRADVQGRQLRLTLGFSHPVEMPVPSGLEVAVEGNNRIRIHGADIRQVGQFAAEIRGIRPPEPYKGKGVRYARERIRRKVGKAGAA